MEYMKKYPIFFFIALSLFSVSLSAEVSFRAQEVLPESTLVYVEVTDAKALCQDMRNSKVGKMFASEEWKTFWGSVPPEFQQMIQMQVKNMEKQAGYGLTDLHRALGGQISLAVVDLQPPHFLPQIFFSWDLGKEKDRFSSFFSHLRAQAGLPEEKYEFEGNWISVISTPAMPIFMTYIANHLVITNNKEHLESIFRGTYLRNTLSASQNYLNVKQKVLGGRNGKLVYINMRQAWELVRQHAPPQAQSQIGQIVGMTGADGVEAIGIGSSFRSGQVSESIYLYTPQQRYGLIGDLLPVSQNPQKLLAYLPENVYTIHHSTLDWAHYYETLTRLLQTFEPREYRGLKQSEKFLEKEFGLSLQEFLKTLGHEILLTTSPSKGWLPDLVLQVSLKEPALFQEALGKILSAVPSPFLQKFHWAGHDIQYLSLSTRRDQIPVAPTFFVQGERFVVTLFPESAKDFLVGKKSSLPQEAQALIENRPYTHMKYLNVKDLSKVLFKTSHPLLQAVLPRQKLPFEPALLPSPDFIVEHLSDIVMLVEQDKRGVFSEISSPIGVLPLYALAGIGLLLDENPHLRRSLKRFFPGKKREVPQKPYYPEEEPPYSEEPKEEYREELKEEYKEEEKTAQAYPNEMGTTLLAFHESRSKEVSFSLEGVKKPRGYAPHQIDLRFYAAIPAQSSAYGEFQIEAVDNLGNNLVPKNTRQWSKIREFRPYEQKKIAKGEGYVFTLQLQPPAREASSFSVKGYFTLKVSGEKATDYHMSIDFEKQLP